MNKVLGLCCVFLLCSAFQCNDEPLEGEFVVDTPEDACTTATINAAEAALNFNEADNTNFESLCNTYKTLLEAQIVACGDANGVIQSIIDNLGDCSE